MRLGTMAAHSSNDRLVSVLPIHIFDKLISYPRAFANPINASALREQILSKLQLNIGDQSGVTVREILEISPLTLLRILDPCLTHVECKRLLSRIHHECAVRPLSALEVIRRTQTVCHTHKPLSINRKIPTGLPTLDKHLQGGLPIGCVAELVGRAGVGKTILAQQLCVLAADAGGGAIYIDAEKKLNVSRLREIAFERILSNQNRFGEQQHHHAYRLAENVLENVTIHPLLTTRELLDTLDIIDNEIILRNTEAATYNRRKNTSQTTSRRMPVCLIIIDSIAAPIHRDFDMMGSSPKTAVHRASALFQIAKKLKQLAYDYQLAVVVVNQVGSARSSNTHEFKGNNSLNICGEFMASLGTAWQYCVSTRIILEDEDDPHRLLQDQPSIRNSVRIATLAKCLCSKRTKLPFELTKLGLCEFDLE